jgi:diketogulonate reductase-like aldo/keto reductase
LKWVIQQGNNIIPILGARTVNQLKDNLGCLRFSLSNKEIQKLNDISKIGLGFPHEFLAQDYIRELIFGGTYSKIDF